MSLNARQKRFIAEFLIDQNATKAAERAGYSEASAYSQAHDLLKNPEIKAAIDAGLKRLQADAEKRARKRGITKERWLKKLEEIAFANMDDFATCGPGGISMTKTAGRARRKGHAIKKISETKGQFGGTQSIELHNPLQALEIVGKHYGWLTENVTMNANVNTRVAQVDEKELAAAFKKVESEY